jgi:hypothetical protein
VSYITSFYEVVPENFFRQGVVFPATLTRGDIPMFEQEVEMEQRQSSVVPLLLIIAMILAFVGVAAYYVVQNSKMLAADEASTLISASLKKDGPVTIQLRIGNVVASVQDRPHGPNYQLFQKAGLLTVGKDRGRITPVVLTAEGRKLFEDLPGATKSKDAKDGTVLYVLPVAERVLVGTPQLTKTGMGRAKAEFMWGWKPNEIGEMLDASGALVKSFNTWDRGTLIDKFGAKFYHGEPTKAAISFVREDSSWKVATGE